MGNYYMYIGRLSKEKGVGKLINAWIKYVYKHNEEQLYICGDGPERDNIERAISQYIGYMQRDRHNVKLLGLQPRKKVFEYLSNAKAVIIPSQWYEGDPMTLIESFSCGIPVIGSNLGNLGNSIIEGVNGAKFNPADDDDMVRAMERFESYDEEKLRNNTRKYFLERYTKEKNKELIKLIYESGRVY